MYRARPLLQALAQHLAEHHSQLLASSHTITEQWGRHMQYHQHAGGRHHGSGGGRGGSRGGGGRHWQQQHTQQQQQLQQGQQQAEPTPTRTKRLDFSAPACAAFLPPGQRAAISSYINRWGPLLQAELDAEQAEVVQRLRTWGDGRLQSEGLMIQGLTAKTHGVFFGQTVIKITRPGQPLPYHRFTSGDLLTLCRGHPLQQRTWDAIVLEKSLWDLRVVSSDVPPGLVNGLWRIDKQSNMALYLRCSAALRSLYKQPPGQKHTETAPSGHGLQASVPPGPAQPMQGVQAISHVDQEQEESEEESEEGPPEFVPLVEPESNNSKALFPSRTAHGGGGRGARGRGKGRGSKKRGRGREDDEDELLPPGTCILDVLLHQMQPGLGPAGQRGQQGCYQAALPSPVMPPAAVEWAQRYLNTQQGGTAGPSHASLAQLGTAGPSHVSSAHAGSISALPEVQQVAAVALDGESAVVEDQELGLNRSQATAVALALTHRVTLIQGPPGTGKTSTIVRCLALLVRQLGLDVPILACAQSNVAVDNLLDGLLEQGVHAVRVGQPAKVRVELRAATLDAVLIDHPMQADIQDISEQLQTHMRQLPSLRGRDKGLGHRDAARLSRQLKETKEFMTKSVLQGAQVICSTCTGAGSDILQGAVFPIVVLDEGSQATEPECLIPLTKGAAHVVLVGDHHQLPPTVKSSQAQEGGMGTSLFERLLTAGAPSALLQVQYRMHPGLSAFPNQRFYTGKLVDGVTSHQRPAPAGLPWPRPDLPLLFIDTCGSEVTRQGGSKSNAAEAELCGRVVTALLCAGLGRQDIGLVTPYTAQVQLLSDQMQRIPQAVSTHQPRQGVEGAQGEGEGEGRPAELEIKSVDGYQGREKEVIVFSAVRCNPRGEVGFLADWRRLNVAITRARRGLVVVGHAATLQADPHWGAFIHHIQAAGCIMQSGQLQLPRV